MAISEFTKRLNAERIAASQFKVDAYVAVVSHHWDRRIVAKRRIAKVYATGNFILARRYDGDHAETQQWRPDMNGTSARQAGTHHFNLRDHLEIWTPAIEAEIAERRTTRSRAARAEAAWTVLHAKRGSIDEHSLLAIEAALGLRSGAPVTEPEIDLTEG